ncbi:hypothetical protein N7462_007229 [Penicillium macrosclerotiorum]|uniref:uncharacterized protein n=1 Tax=Penicillium macrosclerotiorum TaxID=303699 RepID=UPI0025484118|nr:uncharacterized protein N7462_007229 [Penicillium macrosclerotiorum]KAJ5678985.1 hypothetical protein N7462_007229 [Penicillium macrosclerotiorum]
MVFLPRVQVLMGLLSPALGCLVLTGSVSGDGKEINGQTSNIYGIMAATYKSQPACLGDIVKGDNNLDCNWAGIKTFSLNYDWTDNIEKTKNHTMPITFCNGQGCVGMDVDMGCQEDKVGIITCDDFWYESDKLC